MLANVGRETFFFKAEQLARGQLQDDSGASGTHYADKAQVLPGFVPLFV
jgi:hypothetical protein